jgi:S1-C subfamily serine protease
VPGILAPVNLIDILAVVLVVFAALAGYRSGALPQIGGILGALAGAAIALALVPTLTGLVGDLDPLPRAIVVLGGILGAVAVGEMIGAALGGAVGRSLGRGVLSAMDRVAGMVVGVGQALLVLWLAGGLLALGPLPRITSQVNSSTVIRWLAVLPPPIEFADGLGRLLDASGLPDVFLGLEPRPAAPVDRPSDPQADRIARSARGSTARVAAHACGATLSGTGFAVAPGYLVTNAHVVAGSDRVRVDLGDDLVDAKVVMFDPQLDIAVLRAPGVRAPGLRFATSEPDRGTAAAAIGYPEGGPQTVVPAAVAADYRAVGRDIYGRGHVTREILELRAAIEQGDSGGPLVLADGTIGGVVFAQSRTEPEVGYALAAVPVSVAIAPVLGRTAAVGTGTCAR